MPQAYFRVVVVAVVMLGVGGGTDIRGARKPT